MSFLPTLSCKYCSQPIWLPFPSPDETSQRQIPWPQDGMPRNFLCLLCMRACEYSPEDVQWRSVQSPDQVGLNKGMAVHRVSLPCGTDKCAGLVHILVVMRGEAQYQEASSFVGRIYAMNIACERGHRMSGPSMGYGKYGFARDTGWPE